MVILISLFVCVLMGYWTLSIARENKRKEVLAFFLGFLFGLWAVLGYYIAGKKK